LCAHTDKHNYTPSWDKPPEPCAAGNLPKEEGECGVGVGSQDIER